MTVLSFTYRHGIWISVPMFVIGVLLLVFFIGGIVRTIRQARLFDVPLRSQQDIEFTEAERVVLCMEGPLLSRWFAGLDYTILTPYGAALEGRRSLFRSRTTGITKARMELRYFAIPNPGRYTFQISGLGESKSDDEDHRMVFMKPHLGRIILMIIGIIFSATLTIGSIVLFFLRLRSDGSG